MPQPVGGGPGPKSSGRPSVRTGRACWCRAQGRCRREVPALVSWASRRRGASRIVVRRCLRVVARWCTGGRWCRQVEAELAHGLEEGVATAVLDGDGRVGLDAAVGESLRLPRQVPGWSGGVSHGAVTPDVARLQRDRPRSLVATPTRARHSSRGVGSVGRLGPTPRQGGVARCARLRDSPTSLAPRACLRGCWCRAEWPRRNRPTLWVDTREGTLAAMRDPRVASVVMGVRYEWRDPSTDVHAQRTDARVYRVRVSVRPGTLARSPLGRVA